MSRKLIPYPVDYKNTASVRRARRGGNAFVIVLCVLIALLLGAGTFFALVNDGQGWDKLIEFGKRAGADCPFACGTQKTTPVSGSMAAIRARDSIRRPRSRRSFPPG